MADGMIKCVVIPAQQLSGVHMDCTASFDWVFPNSFVKARIRGFIREIHHDGCGVHIQMSDPNLSEGDKTEFTIHPETMVDLGEWK